MPTPAQYVRAKRLVATIGLRRREVVALERLLEATKIAAYAFVQARDQRLDFRRRPELLAGTIELARRTDPETAHLAPVRYHWMLEAMIDPVVPGAKPMKVDFSALPAAARPYLLGPFLGIAVGRVFPRLCFEASRPEQGVLVYVVSGGPVDASAWRNRLPEISAWLGATWTVAAHTASTVTLLRRNALPEVIRYGPGHLKRGALFVGINVDTHEPAYIPLVDLSSGTYIPGASGSGKTNATHLLLRSLFANLDFFAAVYILDGKDGLGMAKYQGRHPKVHVYYDESDAWKIVAELAATIRTRNAAQRAAGIENASRDFIALLVDELPTFIAKPSVDSKDPNNKLHAQFLDNLNRLAMRGRSAGLRMFFVTQSPVAEQIPVTLRTNCLTTIAFKVPENAHATALFQQLDGLPADPRNLLRGRALIKEGLTGKLTHVQFPLVPSSKAGATP